MSISSTFHTSSKAHAITGKSSLSKVSRHNSRGYFSWMYEADKIHDVIGSSADIKTHVIDFLNDRFDPEIEKYNKKQKRSDRLIHQTAAEYFSDQKKLDLANEMIFQLGDKEFWDRWRTDEIYTTRRGKEIILKSFPEEVKTVMDDIYKKMALAYERIYETDKAKILLKLQQAKKEAEEIMAGISDDRQKELRAIQNLKSDKRTEAIKNMTQEEKEEFGSYLDAGSVLRTMNKQRLIERTENDQMHIKLMDLTTHYDEFSTHGHGISVCWTDGFKTGLESRVSKSAVLNKWTLEVIQDKMREIAKEEIDKYPALFQDQELAPKGKGRNHDYTTEQWIRKKQQYLEKSIKQLSEERVKHDIAASEASEKAQKAQQEAEEKIQKAEQNAEHRIEQLKAKENEYRVEANKRVLDARNAAKEQEKILEGKKQEVEKWNEILEKVGDEKEYVEEADKAYGIIDMLQDLINRLVSRSGVMRDKTLEQSLSDAFRAFYDALTASIKKMRMYEVRENLPEEKCQSVPITEAKRSIDDQILSRKGRVQEPGNTLIKQQTREVTR